MKAFILFFLFIFGLTLFAQEGDEPPYPGPNLTRIPSPASSPKENQIKKKKKKSSSAPRMKPGGAYILGTSSNSGDAKSPELSGCKIGEDEDGKPILDQGCDSP